MENLKLKVILIILIKINAYAQVNIEYKFSQIIDTKQENNDLKFALEKKFDSIYKKIKEHVLNNDDKEFIRNICINQKIDKKELKISNLKYNMDKKKINNTITTKEINDKIIEINKTKEEIKNIQNEQKELNRHLKYLDKIKANYIKLKNKIDFSKIDINLLLSEELFFINYIKFKKIGNHYLFEISSITSKGVKVKKELFEISSSVDKIVNKISEHFISEILGREFIKIKINITNNMDAKIYINEKFMAKESYNNDIFDISNLKKKEINIRITSKNFEDYENSIPIKNADTINLDLTLKRTNKEKILITSNVKSKIYKKGIFIGETPLEINKPENSEIIMLIAEGYKNNFKLIDNKNSKLNIKMIKDNKTELILARDKFYINLSIFTISTIASIFTGILFKDSKMLYGAVKNNYIDKKITLSNLYKAKSEEMVSTFLFAASLTLSTTSLAMLIVNLVKYIKTASKGE